VCIFKGVMGCTGTHPPWFCRAFGKLPVKEREKLIVDNKLCPFCLLHDKDKPCGAKQKPASVACTVSGCKGRHAQKLHDLLKDVLREEGRVHVLQEDDGWEESEEAWELGEAEAMIVGAVRQNVEHSWQDTCEAWAAQDEETEAGVYQVGISGAGTEREEATKCKEAKEADQEDEQSEAEGLLVEGEEREYVLELLMREAPPGSCANTHPAKAEPAVLKGKRKRNLEKKLRKRMRTAREAAIKGPRKGEKRNTAGGGKSQVTINLPPSPEDKGGGQADRKRGRGGPARGLIADLGRGVFRIARAGIFPRSSLLGAGQLGFWESGEGGTVG
jgi:hypothetical protein